MPTPIVRKDNEGRLAGGRFGHTRSSMLPFPSAGEGLGVRGFSSSMTQPLSCTLRFKSRETPIRRGEPVTVGLPWPKGAVTDEQHFCLLAPDGTPQTLQTKVLDRWADGSVRWCLFDFLVKVDGKDDEYRIVATRETNKTTLETNTEQKPWKVKPLIDLQEDNKWLFANNNMMASLLVETSSSEIASQCVHSIDEYGIVRQSEEFYVKTDNRSGLRIEGYIVQYIESRVIKVQLKIHNCDIAAHPNGNWDLGSNGSTIIKKMQIHFSFSRTSDAIKQVSLKSFKRRYFFKNRILFKIQTKGHFRRKLGNGRSFSR